MNRMRSDNGCADPVTGLPIFVIAGHEHRDIVGLSINGARMAVGGQEACLALLEGIQTLDSSSLINGAASHHSIADH